MKTKYDQAELVRQALFVCNAHDVLRRAGRNMRIALNRLLEDEIEDTSDWSFDTNDGNIFGPFAWYEDVPENWVASFRLTCWGALNRTNWILGAAHQQDLCLAIVLKLSPLLRMPRQFTLEMEQIVAGQGDELAGVEFRSDPRDQEKRVLMIPLAECPLEKLAEACPRWEEVLKDPLHDAMALALKTGKALNDLVLSRKVDD